MGDAGSSPAEPVLFLFGSLTVVWMIHGRKGFVCGVMGEWACLCEAMDL